MKKTWAIALVLAVGLSGLGLSKGAEIRLEAELSAPAAAGDVSGKAAYRNRLDKGRRQFSIQVEGFEPGTMYDVMVAGQIVGKIVIDNFGQGDLNYDDNFEFGLDDPGTQFPPNFPGLDGGETVEVGPLSGNLQVK